MFIMSLYIAFGIDIIWRKSYKLDALSGAQLAVCSLLLTLTPELIDKRIYASDDKSRGHGLFVTMIVSILSVEFYRFCKKKNVMIKMPEQVPPSVSRSFLKQLIPAAFVIIIMSLVTVVFSIDLHHVVDKLAAPLVKAGIVTLV